MKIEIQRMQDEHIAAVADIERECFSTPWSENSLKAELEKDSSFFYVAATEEGVVGYAGLQTVVGEGYITNVAVLPKMRRCGAAQMLMNALDEVMAREKLIFISLEVRKSNSAALNLYLKNGYRQVGIRKNFYRLPDEDAVIMTKYNDSETGC